MMKSEKDKILFFKGYRIAMEAISVLKKKEETHDELDNYMLSHDFVEHISNAEMHAQYNRPEKYETAVTLENKMMRRRKIKYLRIYSSIGVAAAMIALSFLIFVPENANQQSSVATVQTKTNVPILMLENGKNIVLESEIYTVEKNNDIQYNTIVVPSKYTYTVILSDSTEVILNANSELRYPTGFDGTTREVFLKGEGYFRVKKDSIPFIVKTSELCVKVYGTEFNINTNNRNFTETVLISGSVGVTIDGNDEVMMKPNELFSFNRNNGEMVVKTVATEDYLAWKDNFFKSDNEKLVDLLDEIGLWYGVTFQYDDTVINNISVNSLLLKRTLTIENILKAIEEISNIKFIKEKENNYVIE